MSALGSASIPLVLGAAGAAAGPLRAPDGLQGRAGRVLPATIAQLTGGRYFRADDTETLNQVYATIDKLQTTTAEVKEFVRTEERFMPWVWAGLLLLVLQVLLGETWLRRLP